jgi:kinesin family member C1
MSNRRLSLGGGGSSGTMLRDSSTLHNVAVSSSHRTSSSVSRRLSMGVGMRHETPKKDRHAMLDEYRLQQQQNKRTRESSPQPSHGTEAPVRCISSSRATISKVVPQPPPIPRSNAPNASFVTEGTSALERFRMRKQQKLQMLMYGGTDEYTNNSMTYYENDEPTINYGSFGIPSITSGSTPLNTNVGIPSKTSSNTRRQSLISAGAARAVSSTYNNHTSLSQDSSSNSLHINPSQDTELQFSQLSQESVCGNNSSTTVESMARYEEMQKRLRKLEEEKVGITIAMAPIEARHRQKEDAWMKEQSRLLQEIETLKHNSQISNERYRDLEAQYEAKDEDNRQLRLQVRKESSTLYTNSTLGGDGSAWSRHLQVERDLTDLKEKLQCADEEIRAGRLDRVSVEKELHATKIERDSIVRAYEELQEEYELISKTTSDEREAQIKLEVLTTEHIATSAQLNAVCSDFAATKAAFKAKAETKEMEHSAVLEKYQFEMSVLKTRAAAASAAADKNNLSKSMHESDIEDYAVLKARIEERDRKIAEFDKERLAWEAMRRQMHNRIQELRGNIRVFVRTRPFLPNDGNESKSAIDVSLDGESLSIFDARTATPYGFNFDKVFPPSAGQDHVFEEVSDFVQSAMDGYHVCLFSYGQTGSGKTHTMQGSGNGAMRGIIPRAVEQILHQATDMLGQKWKFNMTASFLEIYNEELKDLLIDMSYSCSQHGTKLAIKRSREGKSYVEGLTEIVIDTSNSMNGMHQLQELMNVAARSRSVASTKMNSVSSRSHSVFMLKLRGYNEESGAEVHGALNLCDLAGSERLDRSGANSDLKRLKETQAINKSLSCLGDVFNALAQKSSHVPFRNSKLTYLLQDCLSGDGKALMFVNLSPTTMSSNESLCSLRFAQRVNQVELGKAIKHIQYNRA